MLLWLIASLSLISTGTRAAPMMSPATRMAIRPGKSVWLWLHIAFNITTTSAIHPPPKQDEIRILGSRNHLSCFSETPWFFLHPFSTSQSTHLPRNTTYRSSVSCAVDLSPRTAEATQFMCQPNILFSDLISCGTRHSSSRGLSALTTPNTHTTLMLRNDQK